MNDAQTLNQEENWYVLRVKPKYEFKSSKYLDVKGILHYLPVVKKKRQWSDRVKYIDFPLFSGYIFVKINYSKSWLEILNYQGNIGFIKKDSKPAVMSDEQINELKTIIAHGEDLRADPSAKFKAGTKVEIVFGPFKGIKGYVKKFHNQHRLCIVIDSIGRTLSTQINPGHLSQKSISELQINPSDLEIAHD